MIKKNLKLSAAIAFGTSIGLCILPRLVVFPELYNETYPPIWLHALITFAEGFAASFVTTIIIGCLRKKIK